MKVGPYSGKVATLGYKLVTSQIIYSLLRWWSTLVSDNCLDMQSCCSKEGKKDRYPVSCFQHVQDFENIPLVDLTWHIYVQEEGVDGGGDRKIWCKKNFHSRNLLAENVSHFRGVDGLKQTVIALKIQLKSPTAWG